MKKSVILVLLFLISNHPTHFPTKGSKKLAKKMQTQKNTAAAANNERNRIPMRDYGTRSSDMVLPTSTFISFLFLYLFSPNGFFNKNKVFCRCYLHFAHYTLPT